MKKLILLLFAFSSLAAVSQPKESIPTIAITRSMVDNPTKLKLSELVDDITFIKLETTKESFVKSTHYTQYTKNFIYSDNKVFTWDGKWKINVGIKGRGTYEEPEGVGSITFKDGKFYSKGYKLIEYDSSGKPTKKVRNLLGEDAETKGVGSNIFYANGQLSFTGQYLLLAAPDALYFINDENFKTEYRMELIPNKVTTDFIAQNSPGAISYYLNNILYCNPFVDNLFYVKDKSLHPIWNIQIDREIKMPMDYFHKVKENILDLMATGGKNWYQMRKGRVLVTRAYETNKYLFLNIGRFEADGSGKSKVYYLCYDKQLKTSKVVRAEDFTDDILGLGAYKLQIFDEKILMELWPHEIFDIIDKKKKAGEKINPKLTALANQINEGDNPIIFVAHLKK